MKQSENDQEDLEQKNWEYYRKKIMAFVFF